MKRIGLFLLAVVMVAGLAGCPGKDDDKNFNLTGFWRRVSTYTGVTGSGQCQPSTGSVAIWQIQHTGDDLTVTTESGNVYRGSYNKDNGDLFFAGKSKTDSAYNYAFNGNASNQNRFSGIMTVSTGYPCFWTYEVEAERVQ